MSCTFSPSLWKSHYHLESLLDSSVCRWSTKVSRVAISRKTSSLRCLWFFISLLPKQQKDRRSCFSRRVRDNVTIVDEVERHDPEAANLISRHLWPRHRATMVTKQKRKCAEGQRQFRRSVERAGRRRPQVTAEALFYLGECGRYLWFSRTTSCTYRPCHSHPCASTEMPPINPSGSRM